MKVKVDENLPDEVAGELRGAGHDAHTVYDENLRGCPDPDLKDRAKAEQRAFVTLDKGVADIRNYPPQQYHGIILLRPKTTGRKEVLAFAKQHLLPLLNQDLTGQLVVISETGIRIRQS